MEIGMDTYPQLVPFFPSLVWKDEDDSGHWSWVYGWMGCVENDKDANLMSFEKVLLLVVTCACTREPRCRLPGDSWKVSWISMHEGGTISTAFVFFWVSSTCLLEARAKIKKGQNKEQQKLGTWKLMSDIENEPLLGSIEDLKSSTVHVDATDIWKIRKRGK